MGKGGGRYPGKKEGARGLATSNYLTYLELYCARKHIDKRRPSPSRSYLVSQFPWGFPYELRRYPDGKFPDFLVDIPLKEWPNIKQGKFTLRRDTGHGTSVVFSTCGLL
ncbi:hypothetical protein TNIN_480761 [Trichonephila inaurata madagascariensis]|uniref:Uncharacterized protein n=1 Tax=Trichonephila inaurata madagascariensis TaxID=2747483 RepID=A0A8X7BU91_9ARAC|nr:hypothetical protein TNIN_480761 [Trichonephila inaurata madagascariensis]